VVIRSRAASEAVLYERGFAMPGQVEFEDVQSRLSEVEAAWPKEDAWAKDVWEGLYQYSGPLVDAVQTLWQTMEDVLKEAQEAAKDSVAASDEANEALSQHAEGSPEHEDAKGAHSGAQADREANEAYAKKCDHHHHQVSGLMGDARGIDRGVEKILSELEKGWNADGSENAHDEEAPHARNRAKSAREDLPQHLSELQKRLANTNCFDPEVLAADGPPVTYV
jgi:chromosome segregation ATPase